MLRNLSRILLVLGAAVLAVAPGLSAQTGGQPVRGDVDGDGRVTAADARIVADYLVGRAVPAGIDVAARGDVNGDGRVTAADAAIINAYAAGRENAKRFPVGTPVTNVPAGDLIAVQCTGRVSARTVACGQPGTTGARGDAIVVGKQGVYVKLTSTTPVVTADTFAFGVSVQNLIKQAMGTSNGAAPDPAGIRIFFESGPNTTAGSGEVTPANADGMDAFLGGSSQSYFEYSGSELGADGILSDQEVSDTVTWKLHFDAGVDEFKFLLYVNAPVQYPNGWIDIYPPAHPTASPVILTNTITAGQTLQLVDSVHTRTGVYVPGAPVTWSSSGHGAATVDASGLVTAVAPGVDTITASSPVPPGQGSGQRIGRVEIVVTAGTPATMTRNSTEPQTGTVGTAVASPPSVLVKDALNNPVSGVAVTFTVTLGGGTVSDGTTTGSAVTINTNASGVATVANWTLGTTAGLDSVVASATGLTSVGYSATAQAGAPTTLTIVSANPQSDTVGSTVTAPPSVKVTDTHNNPVSGVAVKFKVATGAGKVDDGTGPADSVTISTNASGIATLTSWTLGTVSGTNNNTVGASTPAFPGIIPVTFTASAAPGAPATIAKTAGDNQTVKASTAVPILPSVHITDQYGNIVATGTAVTFTPSAGGSVTGGTTSTNATGDATVGSWILAAGANTLTVASGTATATFNGYGNQPPVAVTDSIDAIGNVQVTASGLKGNDTDADGDVLTITAATVSTKKGGSIIFTDGGLTYTPLAGFTGVDSATYTLTDARGESVNGTVVLRVPDRFWFVQGGASGNGTQASPSGNFTFAAPIAAKDTVFLLTTATVPTGLSLPNGGALIGAGATGGNITRSLGGSPNMTVTAVTLLTTGAAPTLTVTTGTGVTLASSGSGYVVRGLSLITSAGAGIIGTTFGSLNLGTTELSIGATGGAALSLTTGSLSGTLTSLSSTGSSTTGLTLSGLTGSLTANAGTLNGSAGGAAVNVTGGSVSLTYSGSVQQAANNATLSVSGGHTGTLTFQTGTVTASNGSGLQFDNADGTYAFSNGVTLSAGDAGIDVLNGSGGTFTFPASSSITNPTADAIRIDASSPSFTYSGRITKTNGSTGITVSGNSGGTVSLGSRLKTITSTGGNVAVNITTTGGASVTSADSMVITSATGNGFNATGGTVVVQGANNTINSVGGIALNVSSATIGAGGLTFKSISANGGSNGIVLSSTGNTAGLTVTGDGSTAGSGGTIQNTTGADGAVAGNGVYLSGTRNVSLAFMSIHDHGGNGLRGTSVVNLTLNKLRFTGANGNNLSGPFYESAVNLDAVTGSASVTGSFFSGGMSDNFRLSNTSGTLNRIVFTSDTFAVQAGNPTTRLLNDALFVQGLGTATVNATVQSSTFQAAGGDLFQYDLGGTAVGDLVLNGSAFSNSHSNVAAGGGGVTISAGGGGSPTFTYNISNNTFRDALGTALVVNKTSGTGTATGTITGNTVGVTGVNNSGSTQGSAFDIGNVGGGTHTVTITNNTLRQWSNYGIFMTPGNNAAANGGQGKFKVTIQGNLITEPSTTESSGTFPGNGIHLANGTNTGDNVITCLTLGGTSPGQANTVNGTGSPGQTDIRLRARFSADVFLPGYAGGEFDTSAVGSFLVARNAVSPTASAATNSAGGAGFNGTCPF
jgi:hypothetical protein